MRPRLARSLPVLYRIQSFRLTNQLGQVTSVDDLRGRVWIADVIFTACPGPCPRMTTAMAGLQKAIDPSAPVRFVSLTTDPERDTPEVLARYAKRFEVDPARWHFLTGTKAQIKQAAVDSLKFTAMEKDPDKRESVDDLFIHSTIFVVVDKAGQARAIFDLEEADARERLLSTVRALTREERHQP